MSDSLQPHGLQHARLPCLSPTPGACSNSCPSSQWCHPTISSSVVPFSSCLQSCPASGSFPVILRMRWPKYWSFSFSPSKNIQDWSPLGWTGWISLQSLSPVNLTLEVWATPFCPQGWGKWKLIVPHTKVWIQPYFTPERGMRFFYAVWPGRLLENHLRAKQDNLLHFIGYVSKRSHPEEFWVTRRKQVFSQELINWGVFSTISGFFFQILYLIPRKLKHMLSKTCQRCQLIQNEWLNLKELTRQGPF